MVKAIILGYAKLIVEDPDFTIQMVPTKRQEEVKRELARQGFDEQGKPVEEVNGE